MFPESPEERSKVVDWEAFVLSMNDVSFSARNGGGSVVIFEREDNGVEGRGRILFHKPHPVAKLDPVILQAMGRRMHRRIE